MPARYTILPPTILIVLEGIVTDEDLIERQAELFRGCLRSFMPL